MFSIIVNYSGKFKKAGNMKKNVQKIWQKLKKKWQKVG